jgi:hypothetical protein
MAMDPSRSAQPPRHPVFDYRPPLTLRLIRWFLLGLVTFAVLSIAYTAYWFYIASAFRDGLPAWIERLGGPGATLAYRQLEISGYPFQFRLIFHEPALNAPAMPALAGKPLRWRAGRIVATMAPWNFNVYTIDLAGDHRIDWPGERGPRATAINAAELTVRTDMRDDGLPGRMHVDVARLRVSQGAASADPLWLVDRAKLNAQRLFPEGDVATKPTFSLDFEIENARIPPGDFPLGRDVARLTGAANIVGKLADPTSTEGLSVWRDAGGIVEFTLNQGKYGPLTVEATGTAALDDALQPITAGTAKVEGLFPAIDALRDRDLIRSRDAAMAKVILGVMSRPNDKGVPTISLPFSIQNRKLFAGPVPLMDVPPIEWPQPRGGRPQVFR